LPKDFAFFKKWICPKWRISKHPPAKTILFLDFIIKNIVTKKRLFCFKQHYDNIFS